MPTESEKRDIELLQITPGHWKKLFAEDASAIAERYAVLTEIADAAGKISIKAGLPIGGYYQVGFDDIMALRDALQKRGG